MAKHDVLDAPPDGATIRQPGHKGPKHILGLDLGQSSDYTALSVTERVFEPTGKFRDTGEKQLVQVQWQSPQMMSIVEPDDKTMLQVRFLHRFELNTDYVVMAAQVGKVVQALPTEPKKPVLVIDHTGVGRGVFDIFRALRLGIPLLGVTITGGKQAEQDKERPWEWSVPKKDLVSALQIVVQNDRLRVAPKLDLAETFTKEMQSFRMAIKASGHVTYEAWRENDHDDLVLSVALACWVAQLMDRGRMR